MSKVKDNQLKHFIIESLSVLIGGFFGCNFRYILSVWIHPRFLPYQNNHDIFYFPFAILIINIIGSFLIGFLSVCLVYIKKRNRNTTSMYIYEPLILVGLIGGFTTVSSYILDSVTLFSSGYYWLASFNILISIFLGFIFCLFGIVIGEYIIKTTRSA